MGQEKFRGITHNFTRNANGVLLVYDVNQLETFTAIQDWIKFVDQTGPSGSVKVLIGNKIDEPEQKRAVTTEQGRVRDDMKKTMQRKLFLRTKSLNDLIFHTGPCNEIRTFLL